MSYSLCKRFEELKKLGLVDVRVVEAGSENSKSELLERPVIDIKNDQGFFAAYDSGQEVFFGLLIETSRNPDVHVVWVEGTQRKIKTLADLTLEKETAIFAKRIPTSRTKSGEYATKNNDFQSNGVWFVSLAGSELQMYEVAIVTIHQGGYSRYYLSLQLVYRADMYHDKDDKIWIPPEQFPHYGEWLSLQSFLAEVIEPKSLNPDANYRQDEVVAVTPPSSANWAKIIWFSQTRRYGFALLPDGRTARLHASQVTGQEFPAFEPGQCVAFKSLKPAPKGIDLVGVREI